MGTKIDLEVAPLGRVEGDLDIKVTIEDGVVTDAWTKCHMFRGFETILRGKDIRAGLIMTPRICGICGGSHLYKACYALDTAFGTTVPASATMVRNIAQACETLQSIPRYFYAIFAIDLANQKYKDRPLYDEVAKRFSAYVGTSYQSGVVLSQLPVEVYAIFGGQWPHSSFMIPGGIMGAPTLSDVTRSLAIIERFKDEWLEKQWLGCSVERWLENKTWEDVLAWVDENDSQRNSDCGLFIRWALDIGLDKYGQGWGNYLATGTFFDPEKYAKPTVEGRNDALITRSGVSFGGESFTFTPDAVTEDVAYSFYKGPDVVSPWDGTQDPIDPQVGEQEGRYSFAKAPRYDVPGHGRHPLEVGPLARQVVAGVQPTQSFQDYDPLFSNIIAKIGPSVLVRQLARMHEAAKYYQLIIKWLKELDLHSQFCITPEDPVEARGYGATEAARGALQDWVRISDGKIENYSVITPSAWNLSPRDKDGMIGPVEKALIGTPVANIEDPIELAHVTRSFDCCLVCTVHAYDGRSGKEMSSFIINSMV